MKQSRAPKTLLVAAALAAVLPIVSFYVALLVYARGIPIFDDHMALLHFAVVFHAAPSLWAKLTLTVAAQYLEYKLILEHVLIAMELACTGRLNLLLFVWLGNLSLLGLLPLLWMGLFPEADRQTRLLLMVPVCWLLFTLNYAEAVDWAMGGLQAVTVIVFGAWSLYLLTRPGRRLFALACFAALLSVCSSANGLFLAPVGLLLLARGRQVGRIVCWLATFALAAALYLFRYVSLHHPPQSLTLLQRLGMLLSFLGGAVENRQHHPIPYASVVLGTVLVAVTFLALWQRYYRENPFVSAFWLWVMLSAAPVVAFRADALHTAQLTGRYKIYSDLLLVLSFAFFARQLATWNDLRRRARPLAACLAACIAFSLFSDVAGVRFLHKRLNETRAALQQRSSPSDWNEALTQAEAEGLYRPPALP